MSYLLALDQGTSSSRSISSPIDSADFMCPEPEQCGHVLKSDFRRLWRTRCRVISTTPSGLTGSTLMRAASRQLNLSARGYHRVLKLARTVADLRLTLHRVVAVAVHVVEVGLQRKAAIQRRAHLAVGGRQLPNLAHLRAVTGGDPADGPGGAAQRPLPEVAEVFAAIGARAVAWIGVESPGQALDLLPEGPYRADMPKRVLPAKERITMLGELEKRIVGQKAVVDALSPLAVLRRGYSITENEEGKIISSVAQIKQNERVQIRLSDGKLKAEVLETEKD